MGSLISSVEAFFLPEPSTMDPEGLGLTPAQVQAQRLNALQDDEETFGVHRRGGRPLGASAPPAAAAPPSSLSCGRLVCLAAGCAVLYGECFPRSPDLPRVAPRVGLGSDSSGVRSRRWPDPRKIPNGGPESSFARMDGGSTPASENKE